MSMRDWCSGASNITKFLLHLSTYLVVEDESDREQVHKRREGKLLTANTLITIQCCVSTCSICHGKLERRVYIDSQRTNQAHQVRCEPRGPVRSDFTHSTRGLEILQRENSSAVPYCMT